MERALAYCARLIAHASSKAIDGGRGVSWIRLKKKHVHYYNNVPFFPMSSRDTPPPPDASRTEASGPSVEALLGDWTKRIPELHAVFKGARPFSHVTIDDFLDPDAIDDIHRHMPAVDKSWHQYHNPIEVKFANNNLSTFCPTLQKIFIAFATPYFVDKMRSLTGIHDLTSDQYLHGAGLHAHPRNGRLMMHLDYEKHPISNLQRRLNIILYMSKEWRPEWNGATELWDAQMTRRVQRVEAKFNRALIFQTDETSWHGVPDIIQCPPDVYRYSLAFYYLSPLVNAADQNKAGASKDGYRDRAVFTYRPSDARSPGLDALLSIRPHRRITQADLNEHMPSWCASVNS